MSARLPRITPRASGSYELIRAVRRGRDAKSRSLSRHRDSRYKVGVLEYPTFGG